MLARLNSVTSLRDSPNERIPIIGFIGSVLISQDGPSAIWMPIRFIWSAISLAASLAKVVSLVAPSAMLYGKEVIPGKRMPMPHSTSMATNRGVVEMDW